MVTVRDAGQAIIIFDGKCNLCNGAVNFIIQRDRRKIFHFTPMQSEFAQRLLMEYGIADLSSETFLLIQQDRPYMRSDAALRIAYEFGFPWRILTLFRVLPARLRDKIYGLIAKNRYAWFGFRSECMVPDPSLKDRFTV